MDFFKGIFSEFLKKINLSMASPPPWLCSRYIWLRKELPVINFNIYSPHNLDIDCTQQHSPYLTYQVVQALDVIHSVFFFEYLPESVKYGSSLILEKRKQTQNVAFETQKIIEQI